ncbi:MAG TPA: threonylcarbamoyl-AMP synthase, partial [Clostridiales bacterium]|nr:threonylcarbamoyl-AMP synthase [Clostridiales bacterium]
METEIIRAIPLDARADADLVRAAKVIRDGGLVVFPTETVYGLGADATSAPAAAKIYAAKGRPSDNPLIIHIAKPEDAALYTYTTPTYEKLARAFMPGPLTVILPSRENIPKTTRGGLDTVAVRCPSHPVAHRLIELSGVPIAAPSANLSGSPSPTSAAHVIDDMRGRVDMIIDGGPSEFGLESTIVKIEDDGSLTLLRPGRITPEELSAVIPTVRIAGAVTEQLKDGEVALSPGMKYRHYAPKCPVFLLDGKTDAVREYLKAREGHIAVIAYSEDITALRTACPDADL